MWPDCRPLSVTKECQIEQFAHAVFPTTFTELELGPDAGADE
jgi:hypothetical protein